MQTPVLKLRCGRVQLTPYVISGTAVADGVPYSGDSATLLVRGARTVELGPHLAWAGPDRIRLTQPAMRGPWVVLDGRVRVRIGYRRLGPQLVLRPMDRWSCYYSGCNRVPSTDGKWVLSLDYKTYLDRWGVMPCINSLWSVGTPGQNPNAWRAQFTWDSSAVWIANELGVSYHRLQDGVCTYRCPPPPRYDFQADDVAGNVALWINRFTLREAVVQCLRTGAVLVTFTSPAECEWAISPTGDAVFMHDDRGVWAFDRLADGTYDANSGLLVSEVPVAWHIGGNVLYTVTAAHDLVFKPIAPIEDGDIRFVTHAYNTNAGRHMFCYRKGAVPVWVMSPEEAAGESAPPPVTSEPDGTGDGKLWVAARPRPGPRLGHLPARPVGAGH